MEIGDHIRFYRKQKGLTQKRLAKLAGLAEITIREYEAGKYQPKTEQIRKLATALDMDMLDLLVIPKPILEKSDSYMKENNMLANYRKLNEIGKQEAEKRIKELTYIPKYCNDTPEHLKIVAAHNDHTDDEEEQQLMQEDLKDL